MNTTPRGAILVADDEGLARRNLVELLQAEGYQVYETADALGMSRKLEELQTAV